MRSCGRGPERYRTINQFAKTANRPDSWSGSDRTGPDRERPGGSRGSTAEAVGREIRHISQQCRNPRHKLPTLFMHKSANRTRNRSDHFPSWPIESIGPPLGRSGPDKVGPQASQYPRSPSNGASPLRLATVRDSVPVIWGPKSRPTLQVGREEKHHTKTNQTQLN